MNARSSLSPHASRRWAQAMALAVALVAAPPAQAQPADAHLFVGGGPCGRFPCPWAAVTAAICPGDCDHDGATTVDELLRGVAIALERQPVDMCPAFNDGGDGTVEIADVIRALGSGLDGCPTARFVPTDCGGLAAPDGQASHMSCGDLLVPEHRAAANGRVVRLRTVILAATGPDRQPDPFVFLTGGPGSAALDGGYLGSLTAEFAGPIQAARDIVILDQRGTGRSRPALECPGVPPFHRTLAEHLSPAQEAAQALEAARACAPWLTGAGVDLAAYDSAATARDVADLMTALGYQRFNLYGLSYGSRVALTALRDVGADRIRSVVLDGPVPLQVHLTSGESAAGLQTALRQMFADCAASPACAAAYPDLEGATFALADRLDAEPLRLTPLGPDGQPFSVVLTGARLLRLLGFGLQSNDLIPFVPLLIDSVARGDTVLLTVALGALAEPDGTAAGLAHAVLCNEETPFNTPAVLDETDRGVDPRLLAAMAADPIGTTCPWDEAAPDPIESEPVGSDVPALVLGGDYDPSTPPRFGQLAASTLSHATLLTFRGFGHVTLHQVPSTIAEPSCAMQVIAAFIADPSRPVDRTCVDALPPPSFAGG